MIQDGACLEIFGINRGETGLLGQNIAQIFAIPGIRAIPGTSIIGKPMAYRLWHDPLRLNYPNGTEGEPLPEVKVRSEFTKDGWVLEALAPMKLPVVNPKRTDVSRTVARKRKLIQLYPDQLRIEFQLSVKIHPNDPWTSHGTMQKSWMASQDTENYAYVEWIDVEEWEEKKGDGP